MEKDDLTELGGSAASDSTSQELVDTVWRALGTVYDPELGIDIVSLGLVYGVQDDHGTIRIEMTLTTPGCPASENLPSMARFAVSEALEDHVVVDLQLVWDPPWDPSMMESGTAVTFGLRRR